MNPFDEILDCFHTLERANERGATENEIIEVLWKILNNDNIIR